MTYQYVLFDQIKTNKHMVNFNYLKIPLFGLIFLLPFLSYGQMSISGTVSDAESGQTLPGVTVVVKGTSTGTVTDIEGAYTLSVPAGYNTLIFSFVGYTTQEVEINNRSVIDLALTPDITSLEEVIVVGYGTQRKSVVTAAILPSGGRAANDFQSASRTSASRKDGWCYGIAYFRISWKPCGH